MIFYFKIILKKLLKFINNNINLYYINFNILLCKCIPFKCKYNLENYFYICYLLFFKFDRIFHFNYIKLYEKMCKLIIIYVNNNLIIKKILTFNNDLILN